MEPVISILFLWFFLCVCVCYLLYFSSLPLFPLSLSPSLSLTHSRSFFLSFWREILVFSGWMEFLKEETKPNEKEEKKKERKEEKLDSAKKTWHGRSKRREWSASTYRDWTQLHSIFCCAVNNRWINSPFLTYKMARIHLMFKTRPPTRLIK